MEVQEGSGWQELPWSDISMFKVLYRSHDGLRDESSLFFIHVHVYGGGRALGGLKRTSSPLELQ